MLPAKVYMIISFVFAAKCNCERYVEKPAGSMVLLSCTVAQYENINSSVNYFWWLNDILMFGGGYKPIDIGFRNVQVTLINNTVSILQIDCLSTYNEGNYTCKIGNDILSTYTLKVTGTGNSTIRWTTLNSNVSWTCCFQGHHVWKFNGSVIFAETFQPDEIGLNNVYGETVNDTFTLLHIERVSMMNTGQYSCTVGGINEIKFILIVQDIKLYLSVDERNSSDVQYLLSDTEYNVTCNVFEEVRRMSFKISLTIFTHIRLNYPKATLYNHTTGFDKAEITAVLPSTMEQSLFLCVIYDENGNEFGEESRLLDIYVVPKLIIQKRERNLSRKYKADVGEILELKCVAFGSRPAVDLTWKATSEHNLTFTKTSSKRNEFQTSTVDYESQLKIVLAKSLIVTCCSIGIGRFHTIETELEIEIDGWKEVHYIIVVGGISVTAVVLIFILQVRLRLQTQRRENAELFALSVWQKTTTSVPNGETDVSMVKYGSSQEETRIIDGPVNGGQATTDNTISSQNVTLLSRLHNGGCKEYWLGRYYLDGSHQNCICETVSEQAQMKDAYNFLSLIKRLRCLPEHSNVVSFLGSCTDEVPYYVYREFMDNGTLRDFLLRNYRLHRGEDGLCTDAATTNFNQAMPHPITFARDVAEAMYFLHNQQLNHPALSASKVLLDYSLICKLHDFWPSELINERILNLTNSASEAFVLSSALESSNPPTGWFPPETIFLGRYDTLSDVWAYGIFLWELFSLGEIPFQFKNTKEIEDEIRNMVLLPQPQTCPGAVYSIMLSTWSKHPDSRPLFADVIHQIHYLQESMASETEVADEFSEWDEWKNDYFCLEPEQHNNCQYTVPFKQSVTT